jgi:hypothetical protein
VIYVPTYDPYVVYYRPVHYHYDPYWSFGVAFPIGVWLTYDFDWGHRVVYYHGWTGYGHGHTWYHASRPYIYINSVYVNPWRTVVVVNRRVVHRYVDYRRFDRYNGIHRRVSWDRRGLPGRYDGVRPLDRNGRNTATYAPRRVADVDRSRSDATVDRSRTATPRGRSEVSRGTQPREATTRGQVNRVQPIPTRSRAEGSTSTTRTAPRTTTSATTRTSTSTTTRTAPRTTTRTSPDYTRRPTTTTSRDVAVNRSARPSTSTSSPRSMPQRSSAPQRVSSAPQRTGSAPQRASAPQRTSSAPQRASSAPRSSAPRASAPSRGSNASAPSRGGSSSRGSAPAREGRGKKGSE